MAKGLTRLFILLYFGERERMANHSAPVAHARLCVQNDIRMPVLTPLSTAPVAHAACVCRTT